MWDDWESAAESGKHLCDACLLDGRTGAKLIPLSPNDTAHTQKGRERCPDVPRLVRLAWSTPAPPCEECRYDHTRAETPFGSFLLTWRGWKEYDSPGFDETPWGEVEYQGWNTVEDAQAWAESEMERRIKECLANEKLSD
jgi:hypothetical protein